VTEPLQRPVTAAGIRASDDWPVTYPDAEVVYEQDADEGEGAGFDNLDLGASAWTFYRVDASWEAIVDFYRERLTARGWQRRSDAGGPYWSGQRWTSADRPGHSIALTHRPPQPWDSWPFERGDGTLFDLLYRVDPAPRGEAKDADA
jgi:hypothetical protein